MGVNAASRTNEKLYQARQLLQLLVSNDSATRSLQNALLNAAVFTLQGAYLAFLLEIAVAHRLKLEFVESLHQLAPLLEKKGVIELAVRDLQQLYVDGEWPASLLRWYREALGNDGWKPTSDKPAADNNAIGIVDIGAANQLPPTPGAVLDVLEKLRFFVDEQRGHLLEW